MKIIELQFKNIHSFKGEATISFDKEPLSSAGIFAIVGATGSGKSTLLDIITLALFNRIPRVNSSISKNNLEQLGSVVTHHTQNAFAEITYQVGQKTYISRWAIEKNKNNNFRDYEMSIIDESGKPLDIKKRDVPQKNASIIGLGYEQFLKSVVLSQGEFAQFLKADTHQRTELLEKITGTEIYRKIGQRTFEKQKEINEKYKAKENFLAQIQLYTPEEIEQFELQIKEKEKEKLSLTKDYENTSKLLKEKEKIRDLLHEKEQLINEREQLNYIANDIQHKQEQYKNHKIVLPHQSTIIEHKRATDKLAETKLLTQQITDKRAQVNQNLQTILYDTNKVVGQVLTDSNFEDTLHSIESRVTTLDDELHRLNKKGKEIAEKIGTIEKENPSFKEQDIESIIEAQKVILKQANIEESVTLESLKQQVGKLQHKQEIHSEYAEHWNKLKQLTNKQKDLSSSIEKNKQELEIIANNKQQQQELLKEKKQSLDLYKKNLEQQRLLASLEEHRNHLVDEEPCPLCGSIQHPYSKEIPQVNVTDEQMKQKENDCDTLAEVLQTLTNRQIELEAGISLLGKTQQNNAQEIESIQQAIASIENTHQIQANSASQANTYWKESKEILQNIQQARDAFITLHTGKHYQDQLLIRKEYRANYKERNEQRKQLCSVTDLSTFKTIRDSWRKSQNIILQLNEKLTTANKTIEENNELLENTTKQLNAARSYTSAQSIEEFCTMLLPENIVQQIETQINNLKEREHTWKIHSTRIDNQLQSITIEQYPLSVDEYQQQITTLEQQRDKNQQELGALRQILRSQKENTNRLIKEQEELKQLKKQNERWANLKELIGDKTGNKFATFAQSITLRNLIHLSNQRLQQFNHRYLLHLSSNEGEIQVIDKYQGNIKRAVATLSGGETFIVSISLALALADMSAQGVALQSLFIDEGFSTLDQETLDTALNTLEQIQTEGDRTMGVISHVEALQERVKVQIQIQKQSSGHSTINIEPKIKP